MGLLDNMTTPSGGLLGQYPAQNYNAANAQMGLTPQEQFLYQMHLRNLYGPGGVDNPDGSRSTLFQSVQEHNGRFYNVPTVWNGAIQTQPYTTPDGRNFQVPNDTALANIARIGWDAFPSYATPEQADSRYMKMHGFMDRDTSEFFRGRSRGPR